MRIYIHAGLPKTGSTSIQSILYTKDNRKELINQDMDYLPATNGNLSLLFPFKFSKTKKDKDKEFLIYNIYKAYSHCRFKVIERAVKNSQCNNALLSGEVFSVFDEDTLLNMKNYVTSLFDKDIEFKVILFFRNPVDYYRSLIQQLVTGNAITFSLPINLDDFNIYSNYYTDTIKKFENIFGDNLIVIKFEDAVRSEKGLVKFFLTKIGINNTEKINMNDKIFNQSSSEICIELMMYINSVMPFFDYKNSKSNKIDLCGSEYCSNFFKKTNADRVTLKDTILLKKFRKERLCAGGTREFMKIKGPAFNFDAQTIDKIYELSKPDAEFFKEKYGITWDKPIKKENKDPKFTPEINESIEECYYKVSKNIRPLIKKYLSEQSTFSENENCKDEIEKLLKKLK